MYNRAWGVVAMGVAVVGLAGAAHAGRATTVHATGRSPSRLEVEPPGQAIGSHVEVLVLQGSDGPGGIAPSVAAIQQLHRPPFSAFREIVERTRMTLTLTTAPATLPIPGGSTTVTSPGRSGDGRFEVVVQITQGGHTHLIHFAARPGDPFFTVTETGPASALILGFTVR